MARGVIAAAMEHVQRAEHLIDLALPLAFALALLGLPTRPFLSLQSQTLRALARLLGRHLLLGPFNLALTLDGGVIVSRLAGWLVYAGTVGGAVWPVDTGRTRCFRQGSTDLIHYLVADVANAPSDGPGQWTQARCAVAPSMAISMRSVGTVCRPWTLWEKFKSPVR